MYRSTKSKKVSAKPKINPGTYSAVVIKVTEAEGYAPGNAIDVFYNVTEPKTGEVIPFRERFITRPPLNEREKAFEAHLDDLGLEEYDDYVGTKLELEFSKEVFGRKVYTNITNRRVLTPEKEAEK